ncbi:MAG: hypothetical protein J07HX5_02103 [halophilic archaeon J07HX5]|nr:MAG: hypothetical protein J07HX5_02103 [halophilic archaeon J07HX5]
MLGCIQFVGLGATLTAISVAPSATQALILFKSNIILVVLVSTTRLREGHRLRRTLGAAVIAAGTVLAVTG